jgi:hypothetical protein
MKWTAAAIVLATFSGPIVALKIQKRFDLRREKRRLKEAAFRTLMATRAAAYRTSAEHVQVLNCIELTFSDGGGDRLVREAWRAYLDMLNAPDTDALANERKDKQCDDAFWDLLYRMSIALGYSFDRTYLKDSCYYPLARGNSMRDQKIIRNGIVTVASDKVNPAVATFAPDHIETPTASTTTELVQVQDGATPGTVPPATAVPETAAALWHGRTL